MDGLMVFEMGSKRLTVFLSRVMRLSCLVSDLMMGGCSLVVISVVDG
jgi:hypothetical protein